MWQFKSLVQQVPKPTATCEGQQELWLLEVWAGGLSAQCGGEPEGGGAEIKEYQKVQEGDRLLE